jgi:hypothetical protein
MRPSPGEWRGRSERSEGTTCASHTSTRESGCASSSPPPTLTLLCARAALLHYHTRCKKLPSDFIEKLPTSIIKIDRNAFEDTPLHEQGIAKYTELDDAHLRLAYDLDETGTIVTFKEGTDTIEGVARADKDKIVEVIIPEGAKVLADKAFEGFKLLAVVVLPQALEEVGDEAFKK